VRELRNEVARLCALSDGSINDPQLVRPPQELTARKVEPEGVPLTTLAEIERLAIAKALSACSGDKGRAADILGISRAKIYQRLKEWREAGVPLPEDAG
jgi:DNA-binding NtrC family response regulator